MKELEKFNTKRFVQRILGRGGILMQQIKKGKF